MKLEHFQYLLEINRCQSISAAAKALHIKQNTLSAIVKSVENELGFAVFRRTPNGVAVTTEGEKLMALAWEINVKYEELISLKQRGSAVQPIHVLICHGINAGLSIALTQRYYAFDLRGNLVFDESARLMIPAQIEQNTANIGITYMTGREIEEYRSAHDMDDVILDVLEEDSLFLFVTKDHPLAGRTEVSTEDLGEECLATVIGFSSDGSFKFPYDLPIGNRRVVAYPTIALAKRAALEQGMMAILPGFSIEHDNSCFPGSYRAIPIRHMNGSTTLYICMLRRKDIDLRYQERIMSTCILDYFKELASENGKGGGGI